MLEAVNFVYLALTGGFLILLVVASLKEREWRATWVSLSLLATDLALWLIFILFGQSTVIRMVNATVAALLAALAALFLIRYFPHKALEYTPSSPIELFDERDHIFSRNNLQFHSDLARRYYRLRPEKERADRALHAKPEIGEPGQMFHDPYLSPAAEAAFDYLARTKHAAEDRSMGKRKGTSIDGEHTVRVIEQLARFYGAADVRFARLRPYHFYSHRGRDAEHWGEAVDNNHTTAVVFVMAMETRMLRQAPALSVLLESSRQYVEGAKVANIVASYLRLLGYEARGHVDQNYETVCVPVAVDAGLGEVGRLGILMHRRLGPCVRLSVVTTDADLPLPAAPRRDASVAHFCRLCKKCAESCPSQAIPAGDIPESRGFRHWFVQQENCYSYWKTAGTDCGICIGVCPYTKPDTLVHRLVRSMISRNIFVQRGALFFDDLLYGKRLSRRRKNPENPFPA